MSLQRLPPEVNRILFVRNLPFKVTSEDLYELFGKYGAIRQIRMYTHRALAARRLTFRGNASDTRGTAYVVYEDLYDAKNACQHLSGFNLMGRYLIVLYFQPTKYAKKLQVQKQEDEITALKQRSGLA